MERTYSRRNPSVSKENSDLIKQYIGDMEKGMNVSSESLKGPRGFSRLNTIRDRMVFFSRNFEERYSVRKLTEITEEQLFAFFSDMKNGVFKRKDGANYKTMDTPARIFKAFWHWYQKINRKKGIEIPDITKDLDTRQEKPEWVYLTEKEVKKLCENAKYEYKVLIMFLFDTGIRSPTELMNVKVSDLFNDFKELNIREETSKTFGRRIKLMLCSQFIKDYIKEKGLNSRRIIYFI